MDFLAALRMKNLFGQPGMIGNDLPSQGGITGTLPQPIFPTPQIPPMGGGPNPFGQENIPSPETGVYDIGKRMSEIYNPETRARDRMDEMLDSYPMRSNPSMLRKIAAGLVNWRQGPQAGQMVIDNAGGYREKLADWKNRIGPVEKAADNERQTNVNERTLAYQTVAAELRQQAQEAKEANDEKKLQIAQQRANVYEFKSKNPNMRLVFPKGGNIQAINPATGETTDTGIPTGSLSEMDRLNLQHENRTAEIDQRGDITSRQIGERGEVTSRHIAERGAESRETKATPSAKTGEGGKTELPTQTRVRQFTAARELFNTRPELKQFIKIGNPGSNDFTITPPGTNFFGKPTGPTPEQYREIQEKIYGKTSMMASHQQPGNGGSQTIPSKKERITKVQVNKKTGAKRTMESFDGGKTWQVAK